MSPKLSEEEQLRFAVECVKHASNGKPDYDAVAKALNLEPAAARKRWTTLLQKYGNATNDGDGETKQDKPSTPPPKTSRAKAAPKKPMNVTTGTPGIRKGAWARTTAAEVVKDSREEDELVYGKAGGFSVKKGRNKPRATGTSRKRKGSSDNEDSGGEKGKEEEEGEQEEEEEKTPIKSRAKGGRGGKATGRAAARTPRASKKQKKAVAEPEQESENEAGDDGSVTTSEEADGDIEMKDGQGRADAGEEEKTKPENGDENTEDQTDDSEENDETEEDEDDPEGGLEDEDNGDHGFKEVSSADEDEE